MSTTTSRVNVTIPSHVNATCHVSSPGNATSHLMEICISTGKLWHLTCEILHGTTCVHACKNEVIIERYHSCIVRAICGQLVTSFLHLGSLVSSFPTPTPYPPLPPFTHPPPCNAGLKLMHTFKKIIRKDLKIKQEITSKVNCILFNRLLSPILLNKSGLVRAKAGNFNLKILNRCFSNYYQV